MPPPATLEVGSATPRPVLLLPGLPWFVVIGALVSLTPIAFASDGLVVLAHLPTFVVLLSQAAGVTGRAREGQRVSPVAIAAVVGGLIASVALMLIAAAAIGTSRDWGFLYLFTWLLLPMVGLVAEALVAALTAAAVGIARLVSRRRKNP